MLTLLYGSSLTAASEGMNPSAGATKQLRFNYDSMPTKATAAPGSKGVSPVFSRAAFKNSYKMDVNLPRNNHRAPSVSIPWILFVHACHVVRVTIRARAAHYASSTRDAALDHYSWGKNSVENTVTNSSLPSAHATKGVVTNSLRRNCLKRQIPVHQT